MASADATGQDHTGHPGRFDCLRAKRENLRTNPVEGHWPAIRARAALPKKRVPMVLNCARYLAGRWGIPLRP
jgi:hypothetical protein